MWQDLNLSLVSAMATAAFGMPEVDWLGDKATSED
jgi:hypothetical protein